MSEQIHTPFSTTIDMASKLIIRRIGSLIPTVCLLIILLFILLLAWLGLVGFPKQALREIESLAADEGIYLKVEKATLEFTRGFGIKLHDVDLYETAQRDTLSLISVPYISLGVELRDLIKGTIQPKHLHLRDGIIRIPIYPEPDPSKPDRQRYFFISQINLVANHSSQGDLRLSTGRLLFGKIPISIQGAISDARLQEYLMGDSTVESSSEPIDLAAEFRALSDTFLEVRKWIQSQQWSERDIPEIGVNIQAGEQLQCHLDVLLPALRYESFRFKDTTLQASYVGDRVTINRLQTYSVIPAGKLAIQGSYDVSDGAISFDINTDLPAIHFARTLMKEEDVSVLSNLPSLHRGSNLLHLQGSIQIDQENNLKNLILRGRIEQENINFRNTQIDLAKVSFFYESGSFSVDQLTLQLPDGHITGQAYLKNGYGQIKLDLHLLEKDLCGIINNISPDTLPSRFADELDLQGHLDLAIKAEISTPNFQPGQSPLIDFVPDLRLAELSVSLPEVTYSQDKLSVHAMKPSIAIKATGFNGVGGDIPDELDEVQISVKADQLWLKDGKDSYEINQYLTEIKTKDIQWKDQTKLSDLLIADSSLFTYIGKVQIPDVAVENINLNLQHIHHIRPFSPELKVLEKGVLELQTGALDIFKRRAESLAILLQLQDSNDISGDVKLVLNQKSESITELRINWKNWEDLYISDINSRLSAQQIMSELPKGFYDEYGLGFNKDLLIRNGLIHLTTKGGEFALHSGSLNIDAPGLLRKPTEIKSMGNTQLSLALSTRASFEVNEAGDYLYRLSPLTIKHESGTFQAEVTGNASTHVDVKGSNTIGLQYLNALINYYDAHAIIRDFKLTPSSKLSLSDINAHVNYQHGIVVHATTKLELSHGGFALGAIIADTNAKGKPTGRERIDTSERKDPFGYFNKLSANVEVDVKDGAKNSKGTRLPDSLSVIINDAVIDFNNRPWLAERKKTKGAVESTVHGDRITLDLLEGFVRIEGLRGELYPAYACGMFFAPLYSVLVDLDLTYPAYAHMPDALFPIYTECKRSMYSTMEVESKQLGHYNFAGIGIPLEHLHGFVKISDDYVQLDRFTSYTWDGKLDLSLRVGITGEKTSLDGYVKAVNMNLQKIAATFDAEISPALCYADFRFRSPSTEVKDIDGYGQLMLRQGELMELGIFSPISDLIHNLPSYILFFQKDIEDRKPGIISKISSAICDTIGSGIEGTGKIIDSTTGKVPGVNYLLNYGLSDANADFRIKNGLLSTDNFVASGSNLRVPLTGHMNLDTLAVDMSLWPDLGSILSLALSPITTVSEHIINIKLTGTIDDLGWRIGADSPFQSIKKALQGKRIKKIQR